MHVRCSDLVLRPRDSTPGRGRVVDPQTRVAFAWTLTRHALHADHAAARAPLGASAVVRTAPLRRLRCAVAAGYPCCIAGFAQVAAGLSVWAAVTSSPEEADSWRTRVLRRRPSAAGPSSRGPRRRSSASTGGPSAGGPPRTRRRPPVRAAPCGPPAGRGARHAAGGRVAPRQAARHEVQRRAPAAGEEQHRTPARGPAADSPTDRLTRLRLFARLSRSCRVAPASSSPTPLESLSVGRSGCDRFRECDPW